MARTGLKEAIQAYEFAIGVQLMQTNQRNT
ncbi:hypothetical protein HALLA_19305 [Halostagnicola larsenii XH-48]|uniref:Uncharacterized protein n=1 Tax=Halostagnicola larsenii XH-48 TaxID=797299 RepID=W0JVU2_9EURY|nr:hypothetical protein HALLA_19305 [Halostagnicola larsenii XH-48]